MATKELKKLQGKAFTDEDILSVIDGKANLIKYSKLASMNNINEALGKYGACIILFLTKQNYGHWCCIFRKNSNTLEFFDSYGGKPDSQLKHVPKNFRKVANEDYGHLSYLLVKSGCNVEYNNHRLQQLTKSISTCGRWVALRLLLRDSSADEFADIFTDNVMSGDDMVCYLTHYQ